MIIIDTREPDSTMRNLVKSSDLRKIPQDEQIIENALPAGDILISLVNCNLPTNLASYMGMVEKYQLSAMPIEQVLENPTLCAIKTLSQDAILLERKTPSDFLGSLADGRLFTQAIKLVDLCRLPAFAITGEFSDLHGKVVVDGHVTEWDWPSVQMAIMRLQFSGCSVVFVKEKNLPTFVCSLWRWLMDGNRPVRAKKPVAFVPLSESAEFLCGLPGIGPEKANDVLEYAGNVVGALHFLTNPDSIKLKDKPFGFGAKTIENIREFFELGDNEVLLPVNAAEV